MTNRLVKSVGVLLAAGAGSRFAPCVPGAKLNAVIDGVTVGRRSLQTLAAVADHVIVATRALDSELANVARASGATVLVPKDFDKGMGYSLAAVASRALLDYNDAQTMLVALADMPWVREATIRRVLDTAASNDTITQPRYAGQPGHPIAFPRAFWGQLCTLTGDVGARSVITAHQATVRYLDVDDPGVLRDVDRPEDVR
jgi:molybdenum cofactor cytidylyltransferase